MPSTKNPLTIPELLELILLYLPPKDLILSQRTSQAFRDTVVGSTRLQRALFLAPDESSSSRRPENNRLLLRAFPGCYPTVTLKIVHDELEGIMRAREIWDVNISFPADGTRSACLAVLYPEASWRKMFLSQPPCKELYLRRWWRRSVDPMVVGAEGKGIRMGDFVDAAVCAGGGGWDVNLVSNDRDWHFEGRIDLEQPAVGVAVGEVSG